LNPLISEFSLAEFSAEFSFTNWLHTVCRETLNLVVFLHLVLVMIKIKMIRFSIFNSFVCYIHFILLHSKMAYNNYRSPIFYRIKTKKRNGNHLSLLALERKRKGDLTQLLNCQQVATIHISMESTNFLKLLMYEIYLIQCILQHGVGWNF